MAAKPSVKDLSHDGIRAEMVPRRDLVPWDRNPRKNDIAAKKLAAFIQENGWGAPILAQASSKRVIAGHTRLKAAEMIGRDVVPVVFLDVDDRKAKALAIADNKLAEIADWDPAMLAEELSDFSLEEADLIGFDAFELEKLAGQVENFGPLDSEGIEEDEVPEVPKNPITKPGDVWVIGEHQLHCLSALEGIPGGRADAMFTDPPYGVSYVGKTKDALEVPNDGDTSVAMDALRACLPQVSKGGSVYVCAPPGPDSLDFGNLLREMGVLRQRLVWNKSTFVLGRSDYHYKHEDIYYGWVPGASHTWVSDRKQTSVLDFDKPSRNDKHPTMKPVALVGYCIANSVRMGELVADPFLGSGTTLIACEQLGRRCVGTEIDPGYCDVIVERWEQLTGGKAERRTA